MIANSAYSVTREVHLRQAYAQLTGMANTDTGVRFNRGNHPLYAAILYLPQHQEADGGLFRCIKDRCGVVLTTGRLSADWRALADAAVLILDSNHLS